MTGRPSILDGLRREVLELERRLAKYGFDEKRGIETYKISEIKKILKTVPL